MTAEFASLGEVSALDRDDQLFYNNPFCTDGPQLRALLESIASPTGMLVLIGQRNPNTGFAVDAAGRLMDVERDWAALRVSYIPPKAAPAAMDLTDLLSRSTAPACLHARLHELGFVDGTAPGIGVEVFVNDVRVDVARQNPFDVAAAATGAKPHVVVSPCGQFAFAAVWTGDRDTAESGLIVLTDGKNLGVVPGNGGNRVCGPGANGLAPHITYIEHAMNIAESKCSELASKQELCSAKAGFAHEAMKGYGIGAGGGRDKQLLLHSMFSGRGLLCVLAAKPRVLKSDDPKEGCFEDKATYVPALEFAAQQILCFTAANPAPDACIQKLLAPFKQYRGLSMAEVAAKKRDDAAKAAAAAATARREKAARNAEQAAVEAAAKAVCDAAAREQAARDLAAAKLEAARRKALKDQQAAERKQADAAKAAKAAEDAARASAEQAARERDAKAAASALARERKVLSELAAERAQLAEANAKLAALAEPGGRGRPRDEEPAEAAAANGAARGAPRPRLLAACADCTAHAKAAADKDAYIARLQDFIRANGLQVPPR
jgi:hypothetical protein